MVVLEFKATPLIFLSSITTILETSDNMCRLLDVGDEFLPPTAMHKESSLDYFFYLVQPFGTLRALNMAYLLKPRN